MEQSMTPHQALQVLKQCAEQAPLPYAQHVVVQHAALTLHHALMEHETVLNKLREAPVE